ncbi:AIPR family protein [Sorangium sp. So ce542]|uniref:AIPR family protein n=1 Tax=Sorangium sp. So ce542 TaxID=3133316 RepID=UPI003F5F3ECA
MHRVLEAHVRDFARGQGLPEEVTPDVFERFTNFVCLSRFYSGRVDLDAVTTSTGEVGIDGVALLLDEELVVSADEVTAVLERRKRNVEARFIFTQSKTSDGFDLADVLKFGSAVRDFFTSDAGYHKDNILQSAWSMQQKLVENIGKLANGRPTCDMFFATSGIWRQEQAISAGITQIKTSLMDSGYVQSADFVPLDREALIRQWTDIRRPVEATFEVAQYMPIPAIKGAKEAYLAIVPAKLFVQTVLSEDSGRLRSYVFEQNVRAFLGEDNAVNSKIRSTLADSSQHDRFAILNNGLTIIAPEVRVGPNVIHIKSFQIVNGCQTSHVLYNNLALLSEKVFIPVKVISVEDEGVIAQIVEATNSQSEIDRSQFLSIRPAVRKIEQYFQTIGDEADDKRLYFERRERQFADSTIADVRIFDIQSLARCLAAMFLDRPDLSARYPSQIFTELKTGIYQESHHEIAYYTAAMAAYRMTLLFNNKHIPAEVRDRKWHLLMVLKYQIAGAKQPALNSKKMEGYCAKILDVVSQGGKNSAPAFSEAAKLIQSMGKVTEDQLKRRPYLTEIKKKLRVLGETADE